MKAKILLLLFCLSTLSVMGQGVITRNSTRKIKKEEPKKEEVKKQNAPAKQQTNSIQSRNVQTKTTPTKPSRPSNGYENGHEWVDLGLSVKWATTNVGASTPYEYGDYYAWGETRTKLIYEWNNCYDCLDSTGNGWNTYRVDGQTRITPLSGHDAARENWGGSWRMPTEAENDELCKKCTWTWTSRNGHNGYTITSPNGNSIFLPAAGWRDGTGTYDVGEDGSYWSSTLSSSYSNYACYLGFVSNNHGTSNRFRRNGRSVRPVTE